MNTVILSTRDGEAMEERWMMISTGKGIVCYIL
jgi:hypothetical protein